ncbi:MAG: CHAT domain-containing protein [Chitinophagaceae bacterium]|nr:CHAT domain-containing protein [Chitinophagaceae bacterium]
MLRRQSVFSFLCLLIGLSVQGRASITDTSGLARVQAKLDSLREKDDLTGWLYARIDEAEAAPAAMTRFLMSTQKEAWRSYRTLPERQAWFNLLILQGYNLLQTGNMLASIQAYEKAMEFYDAYPIADTDEYVEYVLKPLGNNYTRLADYDAAMYIHQKTLQIVQKAGNDNEMAGVYANLATCARWKGQTAEAADYCKLGMQYVDESSALYGLLLNTYADILLQENKTDSALHFSGLALQQLKDRTGKAASQATAWYSAALQLNARLLLERAAPQAALIRCKEAMALQDRFFPDTKQREKAKLAVLMGDILLVNQQPEHALAGYQQALQLLLPAWKPTSRDQVPPDSLLYSENTFTDALAGKAAAMAAMQYKDIALEHYFAVFRAARKLREAFSYTSSRIRDMQVLRERSEAAMALAWDLQLKSPASSLYKNKLLLITELSKAQVLQDERMMRYTRRNHNNDSLLVQQKRLQEAVIYYQHELMDAKSSEKGNIRSLLQTAEYELAMLNKRTNALSASGILTAASLQDMYSTLPEHTSMISFFNGKKNSYLIRFDKNGVQELQVLPGAETLREPVKNFVTKWFGNGPNAMMNQPGQYCEESFKIWQALFGNWQMKDMERCILLPDGIFSYLPFDALVTASCPGKPAGSWPFFFRQAVLSQAWSLQTWFDQQQTVYPSGSFAGWFVAKSRNSSLPELSVDKERKWLQGQIPGKYYSDESATWSAFGKQVDSASVLHIGAHAVAASEGSFPYLQLYDQPFYLFDLQYKHFAPSLVWLGACRTGDGNLVEGEGINSLSRAFAAAGAGGVVAGMWNVNDKAAAEIMQHFYGQLAEGENAANALHNAKEEYLQDHKSDQLLQLPYYWAGFTYSGHLQPIRLPSEMPGYAWALASASLLIMLAFFWWFFKRIYK